MFSSCNVSGIFTLSAGSCRQLANDFQTPGNHWTTNNVGFFFSYYNTLVSCTNGSSILAKVRIPCKSPDVVYADNSIVFITGSVWVEEETEIAYIDGKNVKVITDGGDSQVVPVPSFFSTHMDCLGSVCGEAYVLADSSIVFPASVSVYMLNDIKTFRVMCIYSAENPKWCTTPVPSRGTKVQFSGMCSRFLNSGVVAVKLDDVTFAFNPNRPPKSPSCVRHAARIRFKNLKRGPASSPDSLKKARLSPPDSGEPTL